MLACFIIRHKNRFLKVIPLLGGQFSKMLTSSSKPASGPRPPTPLSVKGGAPSAYLRGEALRTDKHLVSSAVSRVGRQSS